MGEISKEKQGTKRVQEIVPPDQPLPDPESDDIPVIPAPTQSAIRCGYFVGMCEDGKLKFDIVGATQNISDLLGLQEIAAEKIRIVMDKLQNGKFSSIVKRITQLDNKVNQLLEAMGQLTSIATIPQGELENSNIEDK